MKKWGFIGLILAAILLLCPAALAGGEYELRDGRAAFRFSESGALLSVVDETTGQTLLSGNGGDGAHLTVDLSATSIWRAQTEGSGVTVLTLSDAVTSAEQREDALVFTSVFTVRKRGEIVMRRTFTLSGGQLALACEIENNLSKGVVVFASPLTLSGLSEGYAMTWPWHEGERYENAAGAALKDGLSLSAVYPSPLSMQFVAFYNGRSSLYFGVHDAEAAYKTFTFGARNGQAELDCAQSPYLAPGAKGELARTVVASCPGKAWTAAADVYRAFIETETDWVRASSQTMYDSTGYYYYIMSYPNNEFFGAYAAGAENGKDSYMRDFATLIRARSGCTTTVYLGWHDGGFDTDFPDYDFSQPMGGEALFREAMAGIEEDGNKAMIYFNVHTAEVHSDWYNETGADGQIKGYSAATLNERGEMIEEIYWPGYGLNYYAMCPCADDYIDAIAEGVERVLAAGADGAFLDQLMEMPAMLCYNPTHGHTSPATAYHEGYSKMMARLHEIFERYGVDPYFACEGICDAHIRWIDICGLQMGRLLRSSERHYSELTAYTLPTRVLGLPSDTEFGKAQYSRAFLMGQRFIVRENFNETIPKYVAVYRQYPDVYTNGRYEHLNGLSDLPEGLVGSVNRSTEQNRAAISFLNPTLKAIDVDVTYAAPGEIVRVVDAFTGEEVPLEDGHLILAVGKWETVSFIFTWQ
ncbi:MAG: hypothetical protein IJS53_02725 [Clostridia bacterium]|nr:hypothetical protein [Clostridia bacterium]